MFWNRKQIASSLRSQRVGNYEPFPGDGEHSQPRSISCARLPSITDASVAIFKGAFSMDSVCFLVELSAYYGKHRKSLREFKQSW